jgi:hypothetical protein
MMRCKECDNILWSLASKEAGVCTECREGEDTLADMQSKDPEEILETLLKD